MPQIKLVGAQFAKVPRLPNGVTELHKNQVLLLTQAEYDALSEDMKHLFEMQVDAVPMSLLGQPLGVATLDAEGKLPAAQSPNASSDAPWLIDIPVLVRLPVTSVGTWAIVHSTGHDFAAALWNSSTSQNDSVTFDVLIGDGTWDLDLLFARRADGAIYTVELDDGDGNFTTLGTIDGYNATTVNNQREAITGFVVTGGAKRRRLRFTAATRNALNSLGWIFMFSGVQLSRTA